MTATDDASRKRNRLRHFSAYLVAILWLLLAFTTHAETLTGRIVKVADGVTVRVLDGAKEQHRSRVSC